MGLTYSGLNSEPDLIGRTKYNIIPHLYNLFLFQCDVTRSLNRYESPEQTVIDQGRTTLYRLFRYIGQIQALCCVKIGRFLQYTA